MKLRDLILRFSAIQTWGQIHKPASISTTNKNTEFIHKYKYKYFHHECS